jgi:uncharacterized protein (TIGR00106 family)
MSVILEFSMFPTGKGESLSPYVSRILKAIDASNVTYQMTPMGTIIETETLEQALNVVKEAYALLEPDCRRVYSSLKLDIRQGEGSRLARKVESVESKVGKKIRT